MIGSNNNIKACDCIIAPQCLAFMDCKTLSTLLKLNKYLSNLIQDSGDTLGYWQALCNSFSIEHGLYALSDVMYSDGKKKFFFNTLLPAKNKWGEIENSALTTQTFKIEVMCRFRPGLRNKKNLVVPLHQFLKVKRQNISDSNKFCIGKEDPEEFLDPFLKVLMKEPVLLTTSGRILDRSVAVQCLLRGGKDPFNGKKFDITSLVPQSELANKINSWKNKKAEEDIALGTKEINQLINDITVDPELMDVLLDAERIRYASQRAILESSNKDKANIDGSTANLSDGLENSDNLLNNVVDEAPEVNDEIINSTNAIHVNDNHFMLKSINQNDPNTEELGFKSKKVGENSARILDVSKTKSSVTMSIPGSGVRPFYFTEVHDGDSTQQGVYSGSVRSIVSSCLNGFNVCMLCYGQTGSGKTYSMFGPGETFTEELNKQAGIVLRISQELLIGREYFSKIGINISYSLQFVEIYNEKVTDLLTGNDVNVRRENGELSGASEKSFESSQDFVDVLNIGHSRKTFASTLMNDRSSRAHTILVIQITQSCAKRNLMVKSQMHLVDLAGSERVKKSNVLGQHFKEAVGINSSLLVLGKVISSLVELKSHVPYLESKLTTILRSAFGGNSRTVAMINCRADDLHGDETLQSLRFGERCGLITNSIRSLASSTKEAMTVIQDTLFKISEQLISLEQRGKTNLASYKNLKTAHLQLSRKKDNLEKTIFKDLNSQNNSVTNFVKPSINFESMVEHYAPLNKLIA